jgi:ketosteroid isomerase-like protein
MESEAENIVNEFCKAISRKNLDELLTYFSDDAVFHPMMMEPARGKAAIRGNRGIHRYSGVSAVQGARQRDCRQPCHERTG